MAAAGRVLLVLAFATSLYGLAASAYGARARDAAWIHSGRRAMYALALMALVSFVILDLAFIRSDFSYDIVASGSSTTTPFFYRLAAVWATQQGSLLLWVVLLSCWSSLALVLTRDKVREVVPWAQTTLFAFAAFFVALNVFFANPFGTSPQPPTEGAGLDPLLRHTTMMIHPPMLYSGYTLMLVPFAFAVGALVTRRLNSEWIRVTRRFALGSWLCLGLGILLGARWSYTELGWGGFWAWDPVENAALMPWLVSTAYIHSIMIQEKRGMLKVWNASLVLLSGVMAVVGDFLVRSGILSSIHAFVSDPTLNVAFIALIVVMAAGSIALVVSRADALRTEAHLDSLFSREAAFLVQNMVLVALALVVFWVTFFPLISEALTGNKISVGTPAFLPFVDPLALVLVALAGIGPIIPWRRASAAKLRRTFVFPLAAATVTLVVVLLFSGHGAHLAAMAMFVCGAFVAGTVVQEFVRGTRARASMAGEPAPVALAGLVRRNRRRYGGYLVHLGIAIALVGVAASTSFEHQRDATLRPGQSVVVDGKRFTYQRPFVKVSSQKVSFGSVIQVTTPGGRHLETLRTSAGYYPSQSSPAPISRFLNSDDGAQTESRVGLHAGLLKDLWVVVQPNTAPLTKIAAQGDRKFFAVMSQIAKLPRGQQRRYLGAVFELRDRLVTGLAQRWVNHPWPASFRVIVSPLVSWLWIGAILAALGGLIALVPVRAPRSGGRGAARTRVRRPTREPAVAVESRERELV